MTINIDYKTSMNEQLEKTQRLNHSNITICNDDLLYLADHCYNVIGDEKLKSICDRLLLSALEWASHS